MRPRLLENRLSHRLVDISRRDGMTMKFGTTTYFEVFDAKEALAHESQAAWAGRTARCRIWPHSRCARPSATSSDPLRVLTSPGISTVTIREDRRGEHRFVMHQRDGRAVADGGGTCTVMPTGEFQPSSLAVVDVRNDFSLWRNIMREFSEEFLGDPEHDGSGARSTDYAREESFRSSARSRRRPFRLWHYGLVMGALTPGASQRTVAVVDAEAFDQLFRGMATTDDEGRVVGANGRSDIPFTSDAIDRLEPRLSAGSLTLSRLAWRDRRFLLG